MSARPTRVVVWSTGGIGSIAIRAVDRRPDLELVGVWVHSATKVGKDAGELATGEPIGVTASNDVEALIGLRPDCVVYAASGPERDAIAIPDYVRLLEAGINVVTTSTTRLGNPVAYEPSTWRNDIAPDWPKGVGDLSYRVVVRGEPNIDCTMEVTLDDPRRAGIAGMRAGAGAMVATAMRVVNAVPHVVAAAPGLLSSLNLPLTLPKHAFAAACPGRATERGRLADLLSKPATALVEKAV